MAGSGRHDLPTSAELAIWRAHIEVVEMVRARLEAQLHRESHLSSPDYKVLLALNEADTHSMRPSELAAFINWERSRLSRHLGRMEARGLVRRVPHAEDARGADVILTDAGARAYRASTAPHLRAIKSVFLDALTPELLSQVEAVDAALWAHLDREPQSDPESATPP